MQIISLSRPTPITHLAPSTWIKKPGHDISFKPFLIKPVNEPHAMIVSHGRLALRLYYSHKGIIKIQFLTVTHAIPNAVCVYIYSTSGFQRFCILTGRNTFVCICRSVVWLRGVVLIGPALLLILLIRFANCWLHSNQICSRNEFDWCLGFLFLSVQHIISDHCSGPVSSLSARHSVQACTSFRSRVQHYSFSVHWNSLIAWIELFIAKCD